MTEPAIRLQALGKRFSGPWVLEDLNLEVAAGCVLGICGENGAGKSTLLSILAGERSASVGSATVFGQPVLAGKRPLGVGMVHQHFSLVDGLSVAENYVLGAEPRRFWSFDPKQAERALQAAAKDLAFDLDPRAKTEALSVGQKQRLELLKATRALRGGDRLGHLLLLDEPTAVLAGDEIQALLAFILRQKEAGVTVVLVTHKLREVAKVCDRAVVLRHGRLVYDAVPTPQALDRLAHAMIGQTRQDQIALGTSNPASSPAENQTMVLETGSLHLRAGQILGVAGVDGNGQNELLSTLTGMARSPASMTLLGHAVATASVAARRRLGLRAVPADRHRDALLGSFSLADNLNLGQRATLTLAQIQQRLDDFDVRPNDPALPAAALSGGNQQKLLFARELTTEAKLLVVHEPTRGVDFHAQQQIWSRLKKAAEDGAALVVISSDLDELRFLATHVSVLFGGQLSPPRAIEAVDDTTLGQMMAGLL